MTHCNLTPELLVSAYLRMEDGYQEPASFFASARADADLIRRSIGDDDEEGSKEELTPQRKSAFHSLAWQTYGHSCSFE